MGQASATLNDLVASVVTPMGYELVGVEYLPQGRHSILRIYIDTENGINLDDCEKVSRQLSSVLDVEDPVKGQYLLEVSSPGMDRPLFKLDDFKRFVGEQVKLRLKVMQEGRRKLSGRLVDVVDETILVEVEEGEVLEVAFGNIDKANLIPTF